MSVLFVSQQWQSWWPCNSMTGRVGAIREAAVAVVLALQLDDDGVAVDADEADLMGSLGVGAVLPAHAQEAVSGYGQ